MSVIVVRQRRSLILPERKPLPDFVPQETYALAPRHDPRRALIHCANETQLVASSFRQLAETGSPASWGDFGDFCCGLAIDLCLTAEELQDFDPLHGAALLLQQANHEFGWFAHRLAVSTPCQFLGAPTQESFEYACLHARHEAKVMDRTLTLLAKELERVF